MGQRARMASASIASLREFEGGALSGVQGQGAGGLGNSPPEADHISSILCSVFFLHFGMAFIVKCSLTIEHVIIAIPSIEVCLKVRGFMGGGGLSP